MSEGEILASQKKPQPFQQPQQLGAGSMANMAWQYPSPNNMHAMFPSYPG